MTIRVLLIEDDPAVIKSLRLLFSAEGMVCDVAQTGDTGLEMGRLYNTNYDVILLDLMLPHIHGLEIVQQLRSAKIRIPVIIVSGMSDEKEKIQGLALGADDFISKPFDRGELLARVHALVRRSRGHAGSVLSFGKLVLNLDKRTVEVDGKAIHLRHQEYSLLELLAMRRGSMLSREALCRHLYNGESKLPNIKIVDVLLCHIRQKLYKASGGRNYIKTIWGKGYTWQDQDAESETKSRVTAADKTTAVCS